jgi:hypothetical protein
MGHQVRTTSFRVGGDMWHVSVTSTQQGLLIVFSHIGISRRLSTSLTKTAASKTTDAIFTFGGGSITCTNSSTPLGTPSHKTGKFGKHTQAARSKGSRTGLFGVRHRHDPVSFDPPFREPFERLELRVRHGGYPSDPTWY